MVGVTENYRASIIRKWTRHYIEYDLLKEFIKKEFEDGDETLTKGLMPAIAWLNRSAAASASLWRALDTREPASDPPAKELQRTLTHTLSWASVPAAPAAAEIELPNDKYTENPMWTQSNAADQPKPSPRRSCARRRRDSVDEEVELMMASRSISTFMKKMLLKKRKLTPSQKSMREFSKFKRLLRSEVERTEAFFVQRVGALQAQLDCLKKDIDSFGVVPSTEINDKLPKAARKQKKDRELSIVRALEAIHTEINELSSFASLNIIFVIKILKKWDKHQLARDRGSKPLYPTVLHHLVYPTCFGSVALMLLPSGAKWTDELKPSLAFIKNLNFVNLKNETVSVYAKFVCDGDLIESQGKLIANKDEEADVERSRRSFLFGVVFVLVVWFVWDAAVDPGRGMTLWNDPAIYLYSFLGNIIMYEWLWGLSVYIWEKVGFVNYLVLLNLTLQHSPSPDQIFYNAGLMSIVFLVNIIVYYKARRRQLFLHVEPTVFPIALILIAAVYVAFKFISQRQYVSHRLYAPSVLYRIITSPLSPVTLRESFTADVMTSFIKVFSNGAYAICYLSNAQKPDAANYTIHNFGTCQDSYMALITGVVLTLLPLWFRFAQCIRMVYECSPPRHDGAISEVHNTNRFSLKSFKASLSTVLMWPHSYNALKYLMSMIVVIFGLMHPLSEDATSVQLAVYKGVFVLICIAATLYQFYWDVVNDWGLFQIKPSISSLLSGQAPKNSFLRDTLLYKSPSYYYFAIFLDLLLRALWTLSLIPQGSSSRPFEYSLSDQLGPFLAAFELYRRCVWGLLKLEYEHIGASKRALSIRNDTDAISFHFSVSQPAYQDPNKDVKIAVYHAAVGTGILLVVFLAVWASSEL